MGWRYGDWSRILIHGISSSTLCSEQTLSAFHYTFLIFTKIEETKELIVGSPSNTFLIYGTFLMKFS